MKQELSISGDELLKFIPQRPPIVMVDHLCGIDENDSFSSLTIEKNNLFLNDGELDECGIIEHIAQSAALRVGYLSSIEGKKIPIGFIGSVDKLNIIRKPKLYEVINTCVHIIQEVGDITLVSAQVNVSNEIICEGRMKIFLKNE